MTHPQPPSLTHSTVTINAASTPPPSTQPKRDTDHRLFTDGMLSGRPASEFMTPEYLFSEWERGNKAALGSQQPTITLTPSYHAWSSTASIEINSAKLGEGGLALVCTVMCNPKYMCEPHDLVPVHLETHRGTHLMMVLTPTWQQNSWRIELTYTLAQLAKILNIDVDPSASAGVMLNVIRAQYREIGIRARWLAQTGRSETKNSPNHTSGGLLQKGGSGLIRLVPLTPEALRATENKRNAEWNMSERLRQGRPVYDKFAHLIAENEEMATTLEAESEYLVDADTLMDKIVKPLRKLALDKDAWEQFGITRVESSEADYVDYYYDQTSLPLLRRGIVLRRRSVPAKDKAGVYLLAVKGRSIDMDDMSDREHIRLSAQTRLIESAALGADGMEQLAALLSDATVDNVITRVLHDALGKDATIFTKPKEDLGMALKVNSTRYKFAFTLTDSTVIDFSADVATAIHGSDKATVHSFEFGVGHPGLNASTTPGGTPSEDGSTRADIISADDIPTGTVKAARALFGTTGGYSGAGKKVTTAVKPTAPPLTRPYHIPADLTQALFMKSDYLRYQNLRDALVKQVFGLEISQLRRGGCKARTLAQELGMVDKDK